MQHSVSLFVVKRERERERERKSDMLHDVHKRIVIWRLKTIILLKLIVTKRF
jgi:hypothetical protein